MLSGDFLLRSGDREKSSKSGELTGMAYMFQALISDYALGADKYDQKKKTDLMLYFARQFGIFQ